MAKNKIIYGNETLIDLTGDTVSSDNLLSGATAHDRSGEQIQGSVVIPTVNNGTLTIKQNGSTKGTFTANQAGNTEVKLTDTTYESLPESNGGNDVSLVKTGDKWNWNRTFPFKPGLEVASLDDLVGLMDYSFDKRCFSGVIKITTNIGIGVTGWRRIIAIAQNAVNNGTYDIGMFCMFFPADTSDFVNYALIDGKTTGNYSVSKTGQFVTNVFASTVQIITAGNGQLNLGNNLASGATGKSRGRLVIFSNTDTYYSDIKATGLSENRNLLCPDKSGTIAVTDDITDVNVKQTATSNTENVYPILLSNSTSSSTNTTSARKSKIFFKPGANGSSGEFIIQDSLGNECYIDTSGYLKLGANVSWTFANAINQELRMRASNEANYGVVLGAIKYNNKNYWTFCPEVDTYLRLGMPNNRWNQIYSSSATINTSDRNEKKDIRELDESARDLIMGLKPVSFKYINGETGRTHHGMIAQDVEEELEDLGLTAMDFAGFCKDPKVETHYEEDDKDHVKPEWRVVEGEYTYGLRYEEFIPAMIKTIQMQQEEINELKRRIDILEGGRTK